MQKIMKQNMKASINDSIFYSVMVGTGEIFFSTLISFLNIKNTWAGILTVIPLVIGAFLQLASPVLLKRVGSFKKWVIGSVIIQGLSFIPLMILAVKGKAEIWHVFLVTSIYWASGMSAGNAWNVWISKIIPFHIRRKFFAIRSQLSQLFVLLALVLSGIALEWGKEHQLTAYIFVCLFSIALIFRLMSAYQLSKQSEMEVPEHFINFIGLREFFNGLMHFKEYSVILFMLLFQLAVSVSSPFFTPFMLNQVNLSYQDYMFLIASAFISKSLACSLLGTKLRRFDHQKLLLFSIVGIIPLPFLWTMTQELYLLCFFQIISGFFWAIYEQTCFLLNMEMIPDGKRSAVLATYNIFCHSFTMIGTLFGVMILKYYGETLSAHHHLFWFSAILRFGAIFFIPALFIVVKRKIYSGLNFFNL